MGGANRLVGKVEGRKFVIAGHAFELPDGVEAKEGSAILAVRAEELEFGGSGPSLTLLARLFLGSTIELPVRSGRLRPAGGGPVLDVKPGKSVTVSLSHARLFLPPS